MGGVAARPRARRGIEPPSGRSPGALTSGEWEQVRLHSYHSERLLARIPALAELARVRRHRTTSGSTARATTAASAAPSYRPVARVLAVADMWCAMNEPRAYRPQRTATEAAEALREQASAGKLDGEAVDAVLEAVGERPRPAARAAGGADRP